MLRKKAAGMANGELRTVCIVEANGRGASVLVLLDWLDLTLAGLRRRHIVWYNCIMMHRACKVVFHGNRCRCGRQ